jgi:hypothetical protein
MPKPIDDYERERRERDRAVAEVYSALWRDPRYIIMQDRKDRALYEWTRARTYSSVLGSHGKPLVTEAELSAAERRAHRTMLASLIYECQAMAKAGFERRREAYEWSTYSATFFHSPAPKDE